MKNQTSNSTSIVNRALLLIPLFLSIYAYILFETKSREMGLSDWKIVRNISFIVYVISILIIKLDKKKTIKISLTKWLLSFIVSIFSWAVGGFFFDLIRVFQLVGENVK